MVVELKRFSAGLMSVARKREEVKNDYARTNPGQRNCPHKAAIYRDGKGEIRISMLHLIHEHAFRHVNGKAE